MQLLNAKPENVERESEIVAQSGRSKAVTIATNMAGRGTDIILGGNPEYMARYTHTHTLTCMHARCSLAASLYHCSTSMLCLVMLFKLSLPFNLVGPFIPFQIVAAFQPCWAFHCLAC